MGCCISKCQPNSKPHSNINPSVQDKLVISQDEAPPSPPQKRKTVQSPPSITSDSLMTCSTQTNNDTCCSSTLSSASSLASSSVALMYSKVDRSFSNDFLHSCAMENPQIVGNLLDHHVKKTGEEVNNKLFSSRPSRTTPTHQKRARATSPTITRQKSFRVEKEKPINGRNYTMRSPAASPSRRFNNTYTSSYYSQKQQPMSLLVSKNTYNDNNRMINKKVNSARPASPYRNVINKKESRPPAVYLKNNKDRFGHEGGSKVEEEEGVGVIGQVLSKVDYSDQAVPMEEDLDNPHIALDCFIFL